MTHREAIEKMGAHTQNGFCIVVDTWRHNPNEPLDITYRVSYFDESDDCQIFIERTLLEAVEKAVGSMNLTDEKNKVDEIDSSLATIATEGRISQ